MDAKNPLLSKTNLAGLAMVLLGTLDQFTTIFGGQLPSWSLTLIGGLVMVLRFMTSGPVKGGAGS